MPVSCARPGLHSEVPPTRATVDRAPTIDIPTPVNAPPRPSGIPAWATTDAQVREKDVHSQVEPVPHLQNEMGAVPDAYDDGGAPIGPSEEEEAAFLANEGGDSSLHSAGAHSWDFAGARVDGDETASGPLPSLDELRAKISPEVLGLMEELFRAKLTRVTRVNPRDLKEAKRPLT